MKCCKLYPIAFFMLLFYIDCFCQSRNGYIINGITVAGGNGKGDAGNQLDLPSGLFIDQKGDLYIVDSMNDRVQLWANGSSDGHPVAGAHDTGDASNQLHVAANIFVDIEGNIYVADSFNNRIQKWAPGAVVGITVAGGNGYGSAANQLATPSGICMDSKGNLYISDSQNNRIQKWAPNATEGVTVAGGNGKGDGTNQLNNPFGITIDENGNLYIVDQFNNRVQKWNVHSRKGVTVAGGNGQGNASNQLFWPLDLYIDQDKNIYVADQFNHRVQKWLPGAKEGFTVAGDNTRGTSSSQLNHPFGVFLDNAGNIYVSDSNNRVQRFDRDQSTPFHHKSNPVISYTMLDKAFNSESLTEEAANSGERKNGFKTNGITVAGGHGSGGALNQLSYPSEIFIDKNDNLWITDLGNFRLLKLNTKTGTTHKIVGGPNERGRDLTHVMFLDGTFVNLKGDLFISDIGNGRVLKWDEKAQKGVVVAGGNGQGVAANQLNFNMGIYVDAQNNVYVADAKNHRIQKWPPGASEGITIAGGKGQGNGADQLNFPGGIFIDAANHLFVADVGNYRIQEFYPNSSYGITVAGGNGKGNAPNQIGRPKGFCLDTAGNIFISDFDNNRVQEWLKGGTEGITVAGGNGSGSAPNQFNQPAGIAIDNAGNIYIADVQNCRIQKFERDNDYLETHTTPKNSVISRPGNSNSEQTFITLTWEKPVGYLGDLPPEGYNTEITALPIKIKIISNVQIDQSKIRLRLNSNLLTEGNKMRVASLKTLDDVKQFEYEYSTTIQVEKGVNKIQVFYEQESTEPLTVSYNSHGLNLYVLSIGTAASGLKYTQKDALDFANLFKSQKGDGKLFQEIQIQTIIANEATAANIADKISDIGSRSFGNNDVLFVFISSHGYVENGSFKITGSDFKNSARIQTTLDFQENILTPLKYANCKKFIFIDACRSGEGIKSTPTDISDAIRKMITADNSITVITSCNSNEQSWEDPAWQNGAFTKAIKEAFADKTCDTNGDGIIGIDELFAYLEKRVPELVKDAGKTDDGNLPAKQTPKMFNPKGNVAIYVF